jgi:very-short-patch-repair endonuclease
MAQPPAMTGRTSPLARTPSLAQLATEQLGVVSRAQLRELGISRHHVRSQLVAERWQAWSGRVIALMTGPVTYEQRLVAGLLHAGLGAKLDDLTALEALGLRNWETEDVHVLVEHGLKVPAVEGLVIHHSRRVPDDDVTTALGHPSVSAARAGIDAASAMRSERRATGLLVALVRDRLTTAADILECLAGLEKVRHTAAFRAALVYADEGAESVSEIDIGRLLRRAGLTDFRRQVPVMTSLGLRRFDVVVTLPDGSLLNVEVDGPHHLEPEQRSIDAAKDAAAAALGMAVMHVPSDDVQRRSYEIVARFVTIRKAAEARSGSRIAL